MVIPFREEYPFSSHYLNIAGNQLHYVDEGPRNGPVLLMVHGNPTWSFYFRNLVKAFSDKFRVIVPDHMGCGLSDKPQNYPYNLKQHVDNLTTLVDFLKVEDITLVVHDWGGAIGMGFAVNRPDLVRKFVVFNTAAFFVPKVPLRIRMCRWPMVGKWMVRGLNGFVRAAFLFATSQPSRFNSLVKRGYAYPYDNWENRVAIHSFVMDIPLEPNHPTRETLDHIETNLTQFQDRPMLILWGKDDFCFTEKDFFPEWVARFPNADAQVIEQAGHYVVEDAIDQIILKMKPFLEPEVA